MSDTKEKEAELLQKKVNKEKKNNIKLYKWYEPFAWDLLFYYVVEFLFLAGVKGYTSSQIILLSGIYLTGKLLFKIPGYVCVSKYGKKIMLVVGNLSLVIYLLLFMLAPNFYVMIIAEIYEQRKDDPHPHHGISAGASFCAVAAVCHAGVEQCRVQRCF